LRWEQQKRAQRAGASRLRELLREAGRADIELKKVLWKLAFDAHARYIRPDDSDGVADIGELTLQNALMKLNNDDRNWAHRMIEVMKLRAGLLVERLPEVFTFPHRTFQEYLAGAYLADQKDFATRAAKLATEAGAIWREVILLAVGKLVYKDGDTGKALLLVAELCPEALPATETGWRNVWLAGDALLEISVRRVERESKFARSMLQRVRIFWSALSAGKSTGR